MLLTPQNVIDGFTIGADGLASAMPVANASFGIRPFSLAFRLDGYLLLRGTGAVAAMRIEECGVLVPLGIVGDASGMAAY